MANRNNSHGGMLADVQNAQNAIVDLKGEYARVAPDRIELSSAQKKFLNRLVSQMGRMEEALKAAQEALENAQRNVDLATNNASEYLFTCAEEAEIVLGENGWEFYQPHMTFVRQVETLAPADLATNLGGMLAEEG